MNTEGINAELNSQENSQFILENLNDEAHTEYDPSLMSNQQLIAGKKILTDYNNYYRWILLMAQMQSGKTETFLFVAAEMIRHKKIDNVVIFSGNAEIDLKTQLKDEVEGNKKSKFYRKYNKYLRNNGMEEDYRTDIIDNIKLKINIVWGTELKKYYGPCTNTLFIWEESHYAQTIKQCPDIFLKQIGIAANGDECLLRKKGNYVLSISATPFSEICDLYNQHQNKGFVIMEPGYNYNSIERMVENNRIKYYSSLKDGLITALNTPHVGHKYAIIRITTKNNKEVETIIHNNKWKIVYFDSISSEEDKRNGKETWETMENAPKQDTVILIRNKCRMGKNLTKTHILFCFETCKKSNTDTILQGLLGRICGYSTNSENIDMYLSDHVQKTGEINKYIKMTKTNELFQNDKLIMPKIAKNLKNSIYIRKPVIIMKIKKEHNNSNEDEDIKRIGLDQEEREYSNEYSIKDIIKHAFNNNNVENYNTEEDTTTIKSVINNNKTIWQIHTITGKEKTYEDVPDQIQNSFQNKTEFHGVNGSGFTKADNEFQVNIWHIQNANGILEKGDIYIDCFVKNNNDIPDTTKREVFSHGLEDNTTAISNGGFQIYLSPETATSVDTMMNDLQFIIEIYCKTPSKCSNGVHSNQDGNTKENVGIYITKEVLNSLQKNGRIFNAIKNQFNLTLKISKARGRPSNYIKQMEMLRLMSITW
jgi:hypothetical protein